MRYLRLWQAIGWVLVGLVVYLSLTPAPPSVNTGWDKADHLLGYGVLMWWYRQTFSARWVWIAFLLALGLSMEILQALTHYRRFEMYDLLANSFGVLIGWLIAHFSALGKVVPALDRTLETLVARRR